MGTGEEEDEGEMMEDEQHGSAGGLDDPAVSSSADRNVHQGTAGEMEEQHGNTDWKHQAFLFTVAIFYSSCFAIILVPLCPNMGRYQLMHCSQLNVAIACVCPCLPLFVCANEGKGTQGSHW